MNVLVLNSGSNGNAVFVESPRSGDALLLDSGLSRRRTEERLQAHGISLRQVRAIFVTHEHRDHVAGLRQIHHAFHVPVYASPGTIPVLVSRYGIRHPLPIQPGIPVSIGDLEIRAYRKSHDAAEAVFFRVSRGSKTFLFVTDLGIGNPDLAALLPRADGILLESNYDEEMLRKGRYPQDIKERIHSDHGHLSNEQAVRLLEEHCDGRLRTLILGHISENNNTPELVRQAMEALLSRKATFRPAIHIASRHAAGELIRL